MSRALMHRRPLLVIPFGRDQGDIAARVTAHGAGLALPPTASETEIAAAINRLINEPQFCRAARDLRDFAANEVSRAVLVGELEEIVGTRGTSD